MHSKDITEASMVENSLHDKKPDFEYSYIFNLHYISPYFKFKKMEHYHRKRRYAHVRKCRYDAT